jgi:tetratricopeptide (TPR) repeat protein
MNEIPENKRGWRNLRRFLIGLAVLATLFAIFYTEEDWRGRRAWENCKHELEAKGVVLDWDKFIPPTVPDDQNFFKAPIFAVLTNEDWNEHTYDNFSLGSYISLSSNTNVVDRLKMSVFRPEDDYLKIKAPEIGYWPKTTITDIKSWEAYYRAPAGEYSNKENLTNGFPIAPQPQSPAADVLLALSRYDPAIEELRQAGYRPDSRLPLHYENRIQAALEMLQYLTDIKSCVQVLQLRAIAELQNGESEKALDDVKLMLRLNDSIRAEPYLISYLVRIAMTSITLQTVYEGLAQHQWTDAQLAELEQALRNLDFLTDFQFVQGGEQAGSIATIDNYQAHRWEFIRWFYRYENMRRSFPSENNNDTWKVRDVTGAIGLFLMPGGWFYQNKLMVVQQHQDWDQKMIDAKQRLVLPRTIDQVGELAEILHAKLWNFPAWNILSSRGAAARRTARTQVEVDLARTACALERYRIAHAEYPESLDVLKPEFIKEVPNDIFGGKPLHYHRKSDGNFILYSIGWIEKDNGGVVGSVPGSNVPIFEQGDWVWQYPR